MKILIFSDSHRYVADMEHVIKGIGQYVSCVLHLGDCCADAEILSYKYPELRFLWVRGNCDYSCESTDKIFSLDGKRIFITHGHKYYVKADYQRIVYAALEREADACFFGHSHKPAVFYEHGILFMNPGSISEPRGASQPSYGVVDISKNGLEGKIVTI